jgi:hypothetical protein
MIPNRVLDIVHHKSVIPAGIKFGKSSVYSIIPNTEDTMLVPVGDELTMPKSVHKVKLIEQYGKDADYTFGERICLQYHDKLYPYILKLYSGMSVSVYLFPKQMTHIKRDIFGVERSHETILSEVLNTTVMKGIWQCLFVDKDIHQKDLFDTLEEYKLEKAAAINNLALQCSLNNNTCICDEPDRVEDRMIDTYLSSFFDSLSNIYLVDYCSEIFDALCYPNINSELVYDTFSLRFGNGPIPQSAIAKRRIKSPIITIPNSTKVTSDVPIIYMEQHPIILNILELIWFSAITDLNVRYTLSKGRFCISKSTTVGMRFTRKDERVTNDVIYDLARTLDTITTLNVRITQVHILVGSDNTLIISCFDKSNVCISRYVWDMDLYPLVSNSIITWRE